MSGAVPRGTLAVLGVGILAISTAAPLIKLVPDVPPLVVAAFRLGLAALILTPLSLVRLRTAGGSLSVPDLWAVGAAGLCLALHFAAWIASLRYTSVASSVALVTMNPLLLAIADISSGGNDSSGDSGGGLAWHYWAACVSAGTIFTRPGRP